MGKMWVVGKRAKVGKKQSPFFNNTDELREKTCVVKMCGEVREFMQEEFEIEFMSIRGFEKKKQKILPEQLGGEKGGVACSMVFSEDLGNSRFFFFFFFFFFLHTSCYLSYLYVSLLLLWGILVI